MLLVYSVLLMLCRQKIKKCICKMCVVRNFKTPKIVFVKVSGYHLDLLHSSRIKYLDGGIVILMICAFISLSRK
jgi:hypothetical protein